MTITGEELSPVFGHWSAAEDPDSYVVRLYNDFDGLLETHAIAGSLRSWEFDTSVGVLGVGSNWSVSVSEVNGGVPGDEVFSPITLLFSEL